MNAHKIKLAVEEFTSPNPIVALEDASAEELLTKMHDFNVRHIPIINRNKVTGIVSERDLKVIQGLDFYEKAIIKASDVMVKNPFTVNSSTPLDEVVFEMSKNKIGSAIVVDDKDNLVGIFTSTDALNALIEITRGIDQNDVPHTY
jgi:acetoin utilization protein AcuB